MGDLGLEQLPNIVSVLTVCAAGFFGFICAITIGR